MKQSQPATVRSYKHPGHHSHVINTHQAAVPLLYACVTCSHGTRLQVCHWTLRPTLQQKLVPNPLTNSSAPPAHYQHLVQQPATRSTTIAATLPSLRSRPALPYTLPLALGPHMRTSSRLSCRLCPHQENILPATASTTRPTTTRHSGMSHTTTRSRRAFPLLPAAKSRSTLGGG